MKLEECGPQQIPPEKQRQNKAWDKLRRRFSHVSIKWKLFVYLAGFTACMLVVLWVFQVIFLDTFYQKIKFSQVEKVAANISRNIDQDDANLAIYLGKTAQQNDMSIQLVTPPITPMVSALVTRDSILENLSPADYYTFYKRAEAANGIFYDRFQKVSDREYTYGSAQAGYDRPSSPSDKMESMVYVKLAPLKDGGEMMILVDARILPVEATVSTLRVQLILVTLMMLAIALCLAILISRRISSPIIRINQSAKELAKSNYNVHFEDEGYREIAELGETLNYAAAELSKVEGLRRELIANVSHDLRTPLTMISGYGEVMRDLPGENTPENVQIIIDEARRLTSLVNDMLDISKFQSGAQKLHCTRFNLTQAIRDTLGRYNKLTGQDGYVISFASDQEVYVYADELRISQVVYNFINNAITYTGPDKCIYLRQLVEGNSVKIEVRDTGEGIDPDKLQYIWDRYYKVDKAHKRAQIGTGLGLSIVKSILDLHGARYGVKSKTGEGSIFWFELQIDRDPPPEPPAGLSS